MNRFDGKNFKIFRHIPKDSTSLGNNIVRTIFEDERQNLWVGTNRGIYIFNSQQEEFEFFDNKTEDGVLISSNVYDIEHNNVIGIWNTNTPISNVANMLLCQIISMRL